ncbi:DUF775-domain-containing protein [Wilcoxina mikolae CBS 423.85]|nr:DUF775-domain-containing protein [Wilcoxina mikolae CBS 423.85]
MFGCIVAGRAVQTNLQTLTPTQFTFSIPSPGSINHLVVFLLPDTILPPTHAATVHIRFPSQPTFQLLGAISAAKPSAIFRVRGIVDGAAMIDQSGEVTLGISVEPVETVEAQLLTLGSGAAAGNGAGGAMSGALVKAQRGVGTLQLAQRIIGNAFNYLSSFSQSAGGEEMVPLKAFQEWWKKFEKKVEYDPSFLEREGE